MLAFQPLSYFILVFSFLLGAKISMKRFVINSLTDNLSVTHGVTNAFFDIIIICIAFKKLDLLVTSFQFVIV